MPFKGSSKTNERAVHLMVSGNFHPWTYAKAEFYIADFARALSTLNGLGFIAKKRSLNDGQGTMEGIE